jgi:hypothetical protein
MWCLNFSTVTLKAKLHHREGKIYFVTDELKKFVLNILQNIWRHLFLLVDMRTIKPYTVKNFSELYRPKSRKGNEIRFLRHFKKWLIYTNILSIEICLRFKENWGSNTASEVYFLKIDLLHKVSSQIKKHRRKEHNRKMKRLVCYLYFSWWLLLLWWRWLSSRRRRHKALLQEGTILRGFCLYHRRVTSPLSPKILTWTPSTTLTILSK